MSWEFKQSDKPIYLQLIEQIQQRIVCGIYPVGSKLPSVRELACEAAVNPNTMQKALAELEKDGIVYSQRTSGRFITEDRAMIKKVQDGIAKEEINKFVEKMINLGYERKELLEMIENSIKELK